MKEVQSSFICTSHRVEHSKTSSKYNVPAALIHSFIITPTTSVSYNTVSYSVTTVTTAKIPLWEFVCQLAMEANERLQL